MKALPLRALALGYLVRHYAAIGASWLLTTAQVAAIVYGCWLMLILAAQNPGIHEPMRVTPGGRWFIELAAVGGVCVSAYFVKLWVRRGVLSVESLARR